MSSKQSPIKLVYLASVLVVIFLFEGYYYGSHNLKDKLISHNVNQSRNGYLLPFGQYLEKTKFNQFSFKLFTDGSQFYGEKDSNNNIECTQLEVEANVEFSGQKFLEVEMAKMIEVVKRQAQLWKVIEKVKDKFQPTVPAAMQWRRFAGSSVWLGSLGIHFMVSRVYYTPSGIPNKAFVSFLYVQAFDKDWNELEYSFQPKLQTDVDFLINLDGSIFDFSKKNTAKLRKINFPSVLPIRFEYQMEVKSDKYYFGPEDPRVLASINDFGEEEPLIVFNMKSIKLAKRLMYYYFPFSGKLNHLQKRNEPFAYVEKNWTPFIGRSNITSNNNTLNFIYSLVPLDVLTCDMETGMCDFLQKNPKDDFNSFGSLRGGTALVPLPLEDLDLPLPVSESFRLHSNRRIYVGWARMHLNKCGCAESMYRPNLMILVEDFNATSNSFHYRFGDISEYVDFGASIPPWQAPEIDEEGKMTIPTHPECSDKVRNVLIPNSISYWDLESVTYDGITFGRNELPSIPWDGLHEFSSDDNRLVFNDYMALTLSASDSDVSVVHIRGLLNCLKKLDHLFDDHNTLISEKPISQDLLNLNGQCAEQASKKYCEDYAKKHGN